MLDLGAADFDMVAVAEILLNGRGKPRESQRRAEWVRWRAATTGQHAPRLTSAMSAATAIARRRMSRWCSAKNRR